MDNFVGTKLNSRRLARRAKGRMPEVSPLAAYAQLALVNEETTSGSNSRRLARRVSEASNQLERGPERIVRRNLSLHWGAGAEPRIRPPTAACPAAGFCSCKTGISAIHAGSRNPQKTSRSDGQGQRAALDSRAWPAPTSPEGWKKERKINNACKSKTLPA